MKKFVNLKHHDNHDGVLFSENLIQGCHGVEFLVGRTGHFAFGVEKQMLLGKEQEYTRVLFVGLIVQLLFANGPCTKQS